MFSVQGTRIVADSIFDVMIEAHVGTPTSSLGPVVFGAATATVLK